MEDNDLFKRIDEIIEGSIRPVLKADGGDVTLLNVSGGIVTVALKKTTVPTTFSKFIRTFEVPRECLCGRGAVRVASVREGILNRLKAQVPGISEVVVAKGV
ncbi:MAG: NifU family protein [Euryarchaeota archaeon]|nr:NifU family protein [Euryarchaeota archaeon]